jgi:hypothetical protein
MLPHAAGNVMWGMKHVPVENSSYRDEKFVDSLMRESRIFKVAEKTMLIHRDGTS